MKHIRRFVTKLVILSLILVVGVPYSGAAASPAPFTDVVGTSYEHVVTELQGLGIITGDETGAYNPTGGVTRAQMATLIIRAMGRTREAEALRTVASEFSDVPRSHWAYGNIVLASRMGIIKGDAGRFYPNDPVNYAQAATMLVRALGYEGQIVGGYPTGYLVKANDLHILQDTRMVKGTDSERLTFTSPVNRAEAALILYNAIYRAPASDTNQTWSQTVFKQPKSLSLGTLPTYVAPGQEVPLTAVAADAVGNPIPGAEITYSVISGSARISNRTLIVSDSGPITVQASVGNLKQTTTLTPVSNLAITPATFQANKGGTIQLSATAESGGRRVTVQPLWKVESGPATVDSNGQVTVSDYGQVRVKAILGSLEATATGQAVGRVAIVEKPDYLVPGLSYTFRATATDAQGQVINVPVTWSAMGGVIDQSSGRLTSATGQYVTVRATAGGMSEEARIPVLQSIVVTPASANLLIGRQLNFTAKGVDATGKQYDIRPQWDRSNTAVGIINSDGAFAGTSSGSTVVTATLGNLKGQAQLQVAGAPARLSVTASSNAIPASGASTATITVKLLDSTGALSPVDDQPVSLTITDTGRGTLSRTLVLTQKGEASVTYTSGTQAGVATITTSAPGTGLATQALVLTTYAQAPSYIKLTAAPQPLATGGGVATITATLQDTTGFPAPATAALYVTLTASGSATGGLTGTTITIPAGQSSGSISYISGSVPGAVQISGSSSYPVHSLVLTTTNAGPAAGVKIRPIQGVTPVTGLSSLRVLVDVVDAAGVVRANDSTSQVRLTATLPVGLAGGQAGNTWTQTATVSGGTASFQVPAYAVGTATLTASLEGANGTSDTATAEFVPGVFSSLRMSVQSNNLAADGYSTAQVVAEVVDRTGTLLTNVNPLVTFRKLVDGNATTAATDLTVPAVNGRAVLTVRSTLIPGTDTWYATAPGMDTQNLATVTTSGFSGTAYQLRLSSTAIYPLNISQTLMLQVVDQQGRVVTSDSGRIITAIHSIPGLTLGSSSATTQNGIATFTLVGTQATTGTITFTTSNLTVPTLTVPVTFGSGTGAPGTGTGYGSAYSLLVSGASQARVGTPITLQVLVMDAQNNVLTTDTSRLLQVAISGNGTLSSTAVASNGGMAQFQVTGTSAGAAVITVTAAGLPVPTATDRKSVV